MIGLELGVGTLDNLERRLEFEVIDEVRREVVRGTEGRMQIGGGGQRDTGNVVECHFVGETDDGVSLVVQTPAPGPPGHLGEFAAREELTTGVGELGELLERDRPRGHVDAERQRFGREHDREEILLEARFDDLAKGRHHAGVVHGETPTQTVDEVGELEGLQVVVGEAAQSRVGNRLDLATFFGRGEQESVAAALVHRVVAGGPREDEDDHRQEIVALKCLEEFTSSRRSKGRWRRARLGSAPLRTRAKTTGGLHHVVNAARLVGQTHAVE